MEPNPMQCPKCAYERTASDSAPVYECPKCGVVYTKYRAIQATAALPKTPKSRTKHKILYASLVTLALVAAGSWLDVRIPMVFGLVALCIWAVRKAIQGSEEKERNRAVEQSELPYQHCMTCGHDFKTHNAALRGSKTLEVALWILILWPIAFIYSIWRRLGAGKAKVACIVCASNQVVPASAPAAVAHKRTLGVADA